MVTFIRKSPGLILIIIIFLFSEKDLEG